MIGTSRVASCFENSEDHIGVKIGFVFERSRFQKQGLSGLINKV